MKPIACFLSLSFLLLACQPSNSRNNPAGHWEGNITLPGVQLLIRVDLESKGGEGWAGTIDIPAQGVRHFKLSGTGVSDNAVTFGMSGVAGDPKFSGKLDRRGQTISGSFTQAGQTFPFKIERTPKPASAVADETPSKGVPGNGLAGFWQGSLKPVPAVELRLVLEFTNAPENSLGGVLVSVDQGKARVPMTDVSLDKAAVHFETPSIGGIFDGDLSDDGATIEGDWQQLGRGTPITFFRLDTAPKSTTP